MIIKQLIDPETNTYTYLVADEKTKEAILIDPVTEQFDRDLKLIQELRLNLLYTVETHLHADHVTAASQFREALGSQSIVPANAKAACANIFIDHNESIRVGEHTLTALKTCGHTDSHMSYLLNNHCVFTGDSLFIRGCGRTDFQSGDAGTMYDDIYNNLFSLADDVLIYPGHDYRGHTVSTIGEEKQYNPRLSGKSRDEFIEIMNNLNLPNPKKIMEAVSANEKCGRAS